MKLKRKKISFKRKSGRKISFLRRPRKLKKPIRLTYSKKVYKRKVARDKFGQWAGSKRVRK